MASETLNIEPTTRPLPRIGAFAPGNYQSKCSACGGTFGGDKRALNCLNCAIDAILAALPGPSKSAESGEREGWVLVPREPGACELDDSGWLLAFMVALHSRVADTHPIMGWADFDDEQRDRIANAYRALIAAVPKPPEKPRG